MDFCKIKAITKGFLTYIPGLYNLHKESKLKEGHSSSIAEFCYSTWLRILVKLYETEGSVNFNTVAELGPSNSFGVGLCALLSGSHKYIALDVENTYNPILTTKIFHKLIQLFSAKAPIPDDNQFPQINIRLDDYKFPEYIINDELLKTTLNIERVQGILAAIDIGKENNEFISYYYPWQNFKNIKNLRQQNIDLVFSRAVLEHVKSPDKVCKDISMIANGNIIILHDIEYHSHGLSKEWNDHKKFKNFTWKIILGNRPYFLNRISHSEHEKIINNYGFKIIHSERNIRNTLDSFSAYHARDFLTYGGVIVAVKR